MLGTAVTASRRRAPPEGGRAKHRTNREVILVLCDARGIMDRRAFSMERSIIPSDNLDCRYCGGFLATGSREVHKPWNRVLFESPGFVVIPSLGHFIQGWSLIVSKKHHHSIGSLGSNLLSEMVELQAHTESVLNRLYGSVIAFEHGSCSSAQAGACIDHAHLHIVPSRIDVIGLLRARFKMRRIDTLRVLSDYASSSTPYLFYRDMRQRMWVAEARGMQSQYMRRLLAERCGVPEKFDWAAYIGQKELHQFLVDFSAIRGDEEQGRRENGSFAGAAGARRRTGTEIS